MNYPGWTRGTLDELIARVATTLEDFSATRAYDSGVRLHCTEAYLKGLRDAATLARRAVRARPQADNREFIRTHDDFESADGSEGYLLNA